LPAGRALRFEDHSKTHVEDSSPRRVADSQRGPASLRPVVPGAAPDDLVGRYAFDNDQAKLLAEAGADIVVAHMGLTTSGSIGSKTGKTLDDYITQIQGIVAAAKSVRDDVIILCHGGPIAMPPGAIRGQSKNNPKPPKP